MVIQRITNDIIRITLDANGGTCSTPYIDIDRGMSIKVATNLLDDPVKTGYRFIGWQMEQHMPPLSQLADMPVRDNCTLTAFYVPQEAEIVGDGPISEEFKLGKVWQYDSWSYQPGKESFYPDDSMVGHNTYKICKVENDTLTVELYDMLMYKFCSVIARPNGGSANGFTYTAKCHGKFVMDGKPPIFHLQNDYTGKEGDQFRFPIGNASPYSPTKDGVVDVCITNYTTQDVPLYRWFKFNEKLEGGGYTGLYCSWNGLIPGHYGDESKSWDIAADMNSLGIHMKIHTVYQLIDKFEVVP